MSLTSYRAAPPRVGGIGSVERGGIAGLAANLLFRTLGCSTIGAEGFHGRVRDGIGCLAPRHGHQAGNAWPPGTPAALAPGLRGRRSGGLSCEEGKCRVGPRAGVLPLHAGGWCASEACAGIERSFERLVPVSSTGCPAFTSGLSTWWSSTALGETWF